MEEWCLHLNSTSPVRFNSSILILGTGNRRTSILIIIGTSITVSMIRRRQTIIKSSKERSQVSWKAGLVICYSTLIRSTSSSLPEVRCTKQQKLTPTPSHAIQYKQPTQATLNEANLFLFLSNKQLYEHACICIYKLKYI